ncbi:MAG: hypothetical protein KTR31_15380 [Myxococcales bacterium]|nr:hypothetical protein [Myxococcales bacterium]
MIVALLASAAIASPNFPSQLATLTDASCTPTCTACHDTLAGGSGTVIQPFGEALVDRGLTSSTDTLAPALEALELDEVDSDSDGTLDVDAITAGLDPNDGTGVCDADGPVYGCLSHSGWPPGAWLATLTLLGLRSRRSA